MENGNVTTELKEARIKLRKALNDKEFTPDTARLCTMESHLLFAYGTLKYGFPRHKFFEEELTYFGDAITNDNDYLMYNVKQLNSTLSFPVVVKATNKVPLNKENARSFNRVIGSLFLCPTQTIFDIDKIEANGQAFKRVPINVTFVALPDGDTTEEKLKMSVTAWTYLGIQEYWEDVTNIRQIKPTNSGYRYTREHLNNFFNATQQHPLIYPKNHYRSRHNR